MQPLPAWEILHYLPSRQSNPQQKIRAHQPLQTHEQIPAKKHIHCSPRLDHPISLYSHVIRNERLICTANNSSTYLCTSIVIQCLFQWIGRQVMCPHEIDLLNKVLMYPEDFWSSVVFIDRKTLLCKFDSYNVHNILTIPIMYVNKRGGPWPEQCVPLVLHVRTYVCMYLSAHACAFTCVCCCMCTWWFCFLTHLINLARWLTNDIEKI